MRPASGEPSLIPVHSHTPLWVSTLFPQGEESAPLSRADFESRLGAASFDMPMGPRGNIKEGDDSLEPETIAALWVYLAEGSESLLLQDAIRRFQDMSPDENRAGAVGDGPDSLDWKAFAKGLGAKPFDKW